jgi:hypothetical protein
MSEQITISESTGDTGEKRRGIGSSKRLARKIFLYPSARFAGRFLNAVIRPSTIAVLITAVAGPVAVKWTTDEIEKKKIAVSRNRGSYAIYG